MQPESSDGFASVGTILPKEKAALLPGGLFVSTRSQNGVARRVGNGRGANADRKDVESLPLQRLERQEVPMHDFVMGLVFVAIVMAPCVAALTTRLDEKGWR
jgi:hypothetical protein